MVCNIASKIFKYLINLMGLSDSIHKIIAKTECVFNNFSVHSNFIFHETAVRIFSTKFNEPVQCFRVKY